MRDLKNKLTPGKNTKNIQNKKAKSFGYQILGFGSGGGGPAFVVATGGTITESGDFKIHTFTSPGTFEVTCAGSETVDYMVIAGGGGGASGSNNEGGGGGGAGGFRESSGAASGCYTASPLGACVAASPVTAQSYPITVGAGGSGASGSNNPNETGSVGSNSVFSSITSLSLIHN